MKAYQIFFPLFLAVFLAGCIDEPLLNGPNTISGRIVDANGFPCSGFNVYVNYFSKTESDINGNFSLNDINQPYVLTISRGDESRIFVFWNTRNPQTVISLLPLSLNSNRNQTTVHYPALNGNRAIIKFISGDAYYQQISNLDDSTSRVGVYFPFNNNSISGRIIYLEQNTENGVITYEKFGIKDVTLNSNDSNGITFTNEEISLNPNELALNVNIIVPGGMHSYRPQILLSFYNNQNSLVELNYYDAFSQIPLLPLNYKIKVYSHAYAGLGIESDSWVFINPGENANITHNVPPRLLLPLNLSENISDTSLFSIYDNSVPGIYEYFFEPVVGFSVIYLYTNKKIFRPNEIAADFIILKPNTSYHWRVRKFSGYSSLDEFVSKSFIMDQKCKSMETSQSYIFTTAP